MLHSMVNIDPTCPTVKNMIVLDSEGRRMAVKYFSPEWWVVFAQHALRNRRCPPAIAACTLAC